MHCSPLNGSPQNSLPSDPLLINGVLSARRDCLSKNRAWRSQQTRQRADLAIDFLLRVCSFIAIVLKIGRPQSCCTPCEYTRMRARPWLRRTADWHRGSRAGQKVWRCPEIQIAASGNRWACIPVRGSRGGLSRSGDLIGCIEASGL